MVTVLPVESDIEAIIDKHHLRKKFEKQLAFLRANPKHPSLHVELLEPKQDAVYSFRIDRKYRALFVYDTPTQTIEIFSVSLHYQ